jgi:hypothetical protein
MQQSGVRPTAAFGQVLDLTSTIKALLSLKYSTYSDGFLVSSALARNF